MPPLKPPEPENTARALPWWRRKCCWQRRSKDVAQEIQQLSQQTMSRAEHAGSAMGMLEDTISQTRRLVEHINSSSQEQTGHQPDFAVPEPVKLFLGAKC
jgi:hypothetical protein